MTYPKNIEAKLGFNEVRTLLKGRCLSSLGTDEIDRLTFLTDHQAIVTLLQQVREFRLILQGDRDFPSENFFDMRPALYHIQAKGTYLEEPDLYSLKTSLSTIADIVSFLSEITDDVPLYPALHALTDGIEGFPVIVDAIDRILNKYGKIKDDASPELKRIRTDIGKTRQSITINLHRILQRAQHEGYVEHDVSPTFRDGRLVIPIIPALKRKIRGIVHDESASGKTVYIEPAEVVEANNRIRELEAEERHAIIEILQQVSALIRPYIPRMMGSYIFLGKIDAARAKAIVAEVIGGIELFPEPRPLIDLVEAYHPLLQIALRRHGRQMIPLDIAVDSESRILLISGPNAGGKSVCLKTAGLLQYMLQCGLSIPVRENSHVGIYSDIFIDIGDEQSIDDDLSTYSSHLLNMKHMMRHASSTSLILIDEFGGGTEPRIGAAIAQAVLHRFVDSGTQGVITTHYQNLKDYASSVPAIANGAMLYDRQQMQPLFRLQIGHPGSSFAIEIARKTGLPEEVIAEAADIVGNDYIQSDKYLQDIVRDKRYWENKRTNIHQREKRLEELIARYEEDVRALEVRRKEVLQGAKEQAEQLIRESNARIEQTIREIRESQADRERTKSSRTELNDFRTQIAAIDPKHEDDIARKMQQIVDRRARQAQRREERNRKANAATAASPSISETSTNAPLQVGSYVHIKGQTTIATILKLSGKNAIVTAGSMQLSVPVSRLVAAQPPADKPSTGGVAIISRQTTDQIHNRKLNFNPELDVRGMNGQEAIAAVTYFIDDALLLSTSRVRILHGTGTGYLRKTIRQYLNTIVGVAAAYDEDVRLGGAGITVVELE